MIQTTTENKSFINMWRYLQDKDIENNMFMLELKDESLKDFKLSDLEINDKDERSHLMKKVLDECRNNIWFFFREVVRISNPVSYYSGQNCEYNRYILTPIEMLMIFAYDKGISFLASRSRNNVSTGIRTTLMLLELYSYIFKDKDFSVLYHKDSEELIRKFNMLTITNNSIIPELDITSEYKKCLLAEDKSEYFIHINSKLRTIISTYEVNQIEELYNFLVNTKFIKNKQVYGVINHDYDLSNINKWTKMINHLIFSNIIVDDYENFDRINFFDYNFNKNKVDKILLIERYT